MVAREEIEKIFGRGRNVFVYGSKESGVWKQLFRFIFIKCTFKFFILKMITYLAKCAGKSANPFPSFLNLAEIKTKPY